MKVFSYQSIRWAALVTMAAMAGCSGSAADVSSAGDSNAVENPLPMPVTATVSAAGATVVNSDGTGVEVPAGALTGDVSVTVTPTPDAPVPSASQAQTIVGTPTTFGPSGLKFAQPVTVLITFDPSKLPVGTDPSKLVVFTAPEGSNAYEPLPTTVRDGTRLAAATTHFSVFIPVLPPPDFDAAPLPTCTPATCSSLGGVCGAQADGCGNTIDCGPCALDAAAPIDDGGVSTTRDAAITAADSSTLPTVDSGASFADASNGGACVPVANCGQLGGGTCGVIDNCGAALDCGSCMGGEDAGILALDAATSADAGAGCHPLTCQNYFQGMSCGMNLGDSCGGTLDCPCPGDAGAMTDAGVCVAQTTCPNGACGTIPNGCGSFLSCDTCGGGFDGGTSTGPADASVIALDGGSCSPVLCPANYCGSLYNGCYYTSCFGGCSGTDGGTGAATDGGAFADAGVISGDDAGSICIPLYTCANYTPNACGTFGNGCGQALYCSQGCASSDGGATTDAGAPPPPNDGGTCAPTKTCGSYGPSACGTFDNGCGQPISCSQGCAEPDGGLPPPSDASACMTCMSFGPGACGAFPDGCGNKLSCMQGCGAQDAAAPPPDAGACVPQYTCATFGAAACGTYDNGCSKPIECMQGCSDGGPACTQGMPAVCPAGSCGVYMDLCKNATNCGPCP